MTLVEVLERYNEITVNVLDLLAFVFITPELIGRDRWTELGHDIYDRVGELFGIKYAHFAIDRGAGKLGQNLILIGLVGLAACVLSAIVIGALRVSGFHLEGTTRLVASLIGFACILLTLPGVLYFYWKIIESLFFGNLGATLLVVGIVSFFAARALKIWAGGVSAGMF